MAPKISIITPSFNQGQFIEQTIKSVIGQNYPNLEYIVMDGGSTDGTLDILKKYEKELKWLSGKDKGQSDAINKGLKMATGEIVAWLNSDDYYLPGTLNKVAKYFETHTDGQWVTGDYVIIDGKGKEIQSWIRQYKNMLRLGNSFGMLSFANYIPQPSTFWKKSLMEKAGFLHEEYHLCMDYDLWLRFMKLQKPGVIDSPLSAFRIHGQSKGGTQYRKQFEEELSIVGAYQKGVPYLLHRAHNGLIAFVYTLIK